jgi:hypothetical protein
MGGMEKAISKHSEERTAIKEKGHGLSRALDIPT